MRLIVGIILGFAITVGGAYLADTVTSGDTARPMVNWDVVGKNLGGIAGFARDGWKKITG